MVFGHGAKLVVGFEIAVDDACFVSGVEAVGDVDEEGEDLGY